MGSKHRQTWAGRVFRATVLGALALAIAAGPALAASGSLLWTRRYYPPSGRDEAIADMAIDSSGNIYVCGWVDMDAGNPTDYDMLLVKYSPTGVKLWSTTYNGNPGDHVLGYACAVDGSGNVWVVGTYDGDGYGAAQVESLQIVKFTPGGAFSWGGVRNYAGSGGGTWYPCGATDIAFAPGGSDLYVTGWAQTGPTSAQSIWTHGRSTANPAVLTMEDAYAGPAATDSDGGRAVKVGPTGVFYVCGGTSGGSGIDATTIKYSATGVREWARRLDGTAHDGDVWTGLGVDSANNVYVAGGTKNAGRGLDASVAKYSPTGGLKWIRKHDGSAHGEDLIQAIAVNRSRGMLVVTGMNTAAGGNMNALTQRYSLTGGLMWSRQYNGPSNREDICHSAWIGPGGNVYVAGETVYTTTRGDYATLKYSPTGALRWARRYNKSSGEGDMARAVIANTSGVYVSGISYSGVGDENEDIATLKYVP